MRRRILYIISLIAMAPCGIARAVDASAGDNAAPSAAGIEFFESKIRPVLVEKCYECHSEEAEALKGGLSLESRDGLIVGGDSGPAAIPGEPGESLLIQALHYDGYEMPPTEKLPAKTIADFERWVAIGLPDPRRGGVVEEAPALDIEEGRKFWCFQPIRPQQAPAVADDSWPRGTVDRFLLARLEQKHLQPTADADRATWLRRVTFDLIGLPPTPEEIDAFARDDSPDAFEKVVDRLLASPHFGERWGRHWLDVARFAESSGGGRSIVFKDAWRYRDYVIDSFNRDKPLDEFIVEQIAGDLLKHDSDEQRGEHLIATAYLLLGAHNYEEQDKQALEMDVVDEQLDAIGRGLLGMTVACARCHDHKFDPIPTADYYALAGILRSTHTLIHENVSKWTTRELPMNAEEAAADRAYQEKLATLKHELAEAKKDVSAEGKSRAAALQKKLAALKKAGPPRPLAMAVEDAAKIEDCKVCIRGSIRHQGEAVPRGVLQVALLNEAPQMPANQSGRLELAHWIASQSNPLTARVYVNRVWSHLFGAGLVRTADNFGTTGETPTHPELLDDLASRFMAGGWSTKSLVREIALSRAYRMSVAANADAEAVDPENRLLWRMNRRRLDAESLRDAMLAVSGRIDFKVGGPNITDPKVLEKTSSTTPAEYDYEFVDRRRSVYTAAFRNRMHELFEVFDFADQNRAVAERSVTTSAPQALLMLNSPFVMQQARAAAERALAWEGLSHAQRVERAFREALGRPPREDEGRIVDALFSADDPAAAEALKEDVAAWERLYQAMFGCVDFRYLE